VIAITVGNVGRHKQAQRFIDAMQGKSYMNFQVRLAQMGGSFDVVVETDYFAGDTTTEARAEFQDMLNMVMFGVINHGVMK
jgi:hypothetical protein